MAASCCPCRPCPVARGICLFNLRMKSIDIAVAAVAGNVKRHLSNTPEPIPSPSPERGADCGSPKGGVQSIRQGQSGSRMKQIEIWPVQRTKIDEPASQTMSLCQKTVCKSIVFVTRTQNLLALSPRGKHSGDTNIVVDLGRSPINLFQRLYGW